MPYRAFLKIGQYRIHRDDFLFYRPARRQAMAKARGTDYAYGFDAMPFTHIEEASSAAENRIRDDEREPPCRAEFDVPAYRFDCHRRNAGYGSPYRAPDLRH